MWRDRAGFPVQVLGLTLGRLPVRVGDTLGRTLRRLTIPDLSAQGLPRPIVGPATHFRTTGHEVVPGVEAFRRDGVVLADGSVVQPDVVIARPASRPGSSRWSVISVSSMRREGRS